MEHFAFYIHEVAQNGNVKRDRRKNYSSEYQEIVSLELIIVFEILYDLEIDVSLRFYS